MPHRKASLKLGAPIGMTMNSCMSMVLSAWAPPLTTFIIGTGRTWAFGPPMERYSGKLNSSAAALADGQAGAQHCVCAETSLVVGAVELDQDRVDQSLLQRIKTVPVRRRSRH